MKQSVYICGDSFCASDLDYPEITPWHEQVEGAISLGRVCASNLLIAQQVNKAIRSDADFIIVEFTSSLRSELLWKGEVVPFSWLSLDDTTPFDDKTLTMLKQKFEYVDLNTEIERNKLIINATLTNLASSDIPFLFDQGGFEHPSYGGVGTYFKEFDEYRSKYCLWDYADKRTHRPYFHIEDQSIHDMIADYYNNFIQA